MPNTMTSARESGGTKAGVILDNAVRDVYSQEILFNAQPLLLFRQFAEYQSDLLSNPGDTIKFTKYNDLEGDSELSEVEAIEHTNLQSSQIAIEVKEHGFGVSESERLIRTAWDNVVGRATLLLGQHYGRSLDALIRRQFVAAASLQQIYSAAAAVNRSTLVAADTFNVRMVKDAAEQLAINKTPKFGDSYICILHPHQSRGIRDDSDWVEAHKYASPGEIFRGEIGRIEGVRFIETTNVSSVRASGQVWADGKNTGKTEAVLPTVTTYQAMCLGANAVGFAEALPAEFRMDDSEDYGRTRKMAWYGIHGVGSIEDQNVVGLESA